jgi:hypothetical protein
VGIGGVRIGPPGYTGWRNRFLGIDCWASYKYGLRNKVMPADTPLASYPAPPAGPDIDLQQHNFTQGKLSITDQNKKGGFRMQSHS